MNDWITLATAVALLGGPLIVIWREIRKTKAEAITAAQTAAAAKLAVDGVHQIVNSQRTEMLAYQDVLTRALTTAGVKVPHDAALTPTEGP